MKNVLYGVMFLLFSVSVLASVNDSINTDALYYYNFSTGDGSIDSTGNGIIYEDSSGNLNSSANGYIGNGMNYSGINSFNPASAIGALESFTVCEAVYPSALFFQSYPNIGEAYLYVDGNTQGIEWSTYNKTHRSITRFACYTDSFENQYWYNSTEDSITFDAWNYICFSRTSRTNLKIYINGVLDSEFVGMDNCVLSDPNEEFSSNILQEKWNVFPKSNVDEFGVWNRALTDEEIEFLYARTLLDESYPFTIPEAEPEPEPEPSPITGYGILGGVGTCSETQWMPFLIFGILAMVFFAIAVQIFNGAKGVAKVMPILLLVFGVTMILIWLVGC